VDAHTFDELARVLAAALTRRRAMSLLVGGSLGGFYQILTGPEAAAKHHHHHRHHHKHKKRCIENSVPFGKDSKRCKRDKDCCGQGSCCNFGEGRHCFDLTRHTTACGASCETVVNCFNTGRECVDSVCVEASP
jgi:hypothetical protein